MKLTKRVSGFCLLLLLLMQVPYFASGQTDTSSIQGKFDTYRQQVLQEKIFVHTDKAFYFSGEILWFKIYCVDATFHKPIDVSKVAYIELLDNENKPLLQAKIELKNGSGNGSFYLPLSVNSGNYKMRAYTNWMKNFPAEYFFDKNVSIVNTLKTAVKSPQQADDHYDIQFFPEGGNLVQGIQSKVAFRIVNTVGHGINFSGKVVDENNNIIESFRPAKFGIGNFLFTPVAGHSYKAIIYPESKDSLVKELPAIHDFGYVMSLSEQENGNLEVKIQTNTKSAFTNEQVFLFVHTRQMIKVAEKINLVNGIAEFKIDKKILGEGISTITLFNINKQPLSERLYFKRPLQNLIIDVVPNAGKYSPRGKVSLEINTHNAAGIAESAELSVSVYKHDLLQTIDPVTIFNYLWLSSDLAGNIESPEYYFNNSGVEIDQEMDNLMLTNGWRRFNWDDLLKNKIPVFHFLPEYEGHIIRGKISDVRSNIPAGNVLTYLAVPANHSQFYNSTSNANGEISFYTHNFYNTGEIVVQPACEAENYFKLLVEDPFSESYTPNNSPSLLISGKLQNEFLEHSIAMQVQNIYTGKRLSQLKESKTDSIPFYVTADRKYLLDDYTRFGTMEEVIREYVSGVSLNKKKNSFFIKLANDQKMEYFGKDPLVLFDGIPVCDFTDIINYDPLQIKKIEVVNKKYYSGPLEFDGIISFTTYKGNHPDLKLNPNALAIDYEGLQKQRQFYSPVYEAKSTVTDHIPDFRNLLYWSPDIRTNALGKAQASFFTSDQTGEYIIIVQGLTPNGNAGVKHSYLFVK